MRSRGEISRHRHHGTLGAATDFVAEHEKVRASAVRQVHDLARRWAPLRISGECLTAARIIQSARQINEIQLGREVAQWASITVVRRCGWRRGHDFFLGRRRRVRHQVDHRGRCPFPFRAGHRDRSVGQQAQAIGIAKPGRQRLRRVAVGRNGQQSLIARHRVEISGRVPLQPANEVVPCR